MRPPSEPRIYLAAITAIPVLLILVNQTVATSLLYSLRTVSFAIWLAFMTSYMVLRRRGYLSKITSVLTQVAVETTMLSAPLAYPMLMIFTQASPEEYEGTFMIYLIFGIMLMFYQIGRRRSVGSVGKIASFLLAYLFALMIYAGAVAGQQIGSSFLLIVAFDQLFRVGALAGYPLYLISLPLPTYLRASLALATPAIIFLALSAELERAEAGGELRSVGVKLVSSLRPAVMLFTFAGALSMGLTIPLSLWLGEQNLRYTTLLPPLGLAALLMLILVVWERRLGEKIS